MTLEVEIRRTRGRVDYKVTLSQAIPQDMRTEIAEEIGREPVLRFEYPGEIGSIWEPNPVIHMYVVKIGAYAGVHLLTVYDQSLYTAIHAAGNLQGRAFKVERVVSGEQYCYELKEQEVKTWDE